MYGPAPFCAAIRYSGISSSAFCTSSMVVGFFFANHLLRKSTTRLSVGVCAEKNGTSSSRAASMAWS